MTCLLSLFIAFMQRLSQDAKQAILFRGRMESVEKWMGQRKLPQRLKNRIANYYAEVRYTRSNLKSMTPAIDFQNCKSPYHSVALVFKGRLPQHDSRLKAEAFTNV